MSNDGTYTAEQAATRESWIASITPVYPTLTPKVLSGMSCRLLGELAALASEEAEIRTAANEARNKRRIAQAAALRGLRALAGLTQDKLAARIGLSHPTFGAVEAGRHPKFQEHRSNVLAALGVTEEDFSTLTRMAAELAERKEATNNARKQRKVRKAGSPKRPGR